MTDRDLTPAEEERVRRLLADARPAGPMPPEVVARLEGVLAELAVSQPVPTGAAAGAPDAGPATAPVVDLARRRRRRRVGSVLVAAAAVTVIGVGLPTALRGGLGTTSSDDSGGSVAQEATVRRGTPPAVAATARWTGGDESGRLRPGGADRRRPRRPPR